MAWPYYMLAQWTAVISQRELGYSHNLDRRGHGVPTELSQLGAHDHQEEGTVLTKSPSTVP